MLTTFEIPADCVVAHAEEHDVFCLSVNGGTWRRLRVSAEDEYMRLASLEEKAQYRLTLTSKTTRGVSEANVVTPPPNIHGDQPFLVKIQRSLDPGCDTMLIYDRQKTVLAFLLRISDPPAYDEALNDMRNAYKVKIYRWARRTGEFELSVCLDKSPEQDPDW